MNSFFPNLIHPVFGSNLSFGFSYTRTTILVCQPCRGFFIPFTCSSILSWLILPLLMALSALSISVSGKTHRSICFLFHLFLMITSVISVIKLLKRVCLFLAFILNERWWFCPAASVRLHSALSHSTMKIQHLFEHNSKERGCGTFLIYNKFSQQEFHVVNNSGGIKFYYFPYVLGYNSMKYLTWSTCLKFWSILNQG